MKKDRPIGNNESIVNPHDKVVRDFFSENETAKSFFQEYLPPEITKAMDFATLEITKDSFIDKELDQYFSDLLYQVKLNGTEAFVYFLIEHKSYEDYFTSFQLLKYMVKIWELNLKQDKKTRTLPVILPMVIYHGAKEWSINTDFISLFSGNHLKEVADFIPNFRFNLYDISHLPDEEIKGVVHLKILFKTLKYIFTPGLVHKLPEIFQLFEELEDKQKGTEYLEVLLRYLAGSVNDLKEGELKESVSKSIIEGGDMMATIAENWMKKGIEKGMEKGIKKGIVKGRQEGIEKGKLETAKELIKHGVSSEIIYKSTGIPPQKIDQIKKQLEKH